MSLFPLLNILDSLSLLRKYVIKQALHFLSEWQNIEQQTYSISVNLSPRQFRDASLLSFIKNTLMDTNISSECLDLEITEGVLMSDQSYIHEALAEINVLGIQLAMDDFGTGYSSLSYLRQYPFDVLKIDRSFIHGIALDLVKATIIMSHSLGLTVVAEGVETIEQLTLLAELGCDFVQGYYLSKPLPANQLFDFSNSYR